MRPTFIDLFAGCGGLSLGLSLAGWQGLFCVEKDPLAFSTFRANLIDLDAPGASRFQWPNWLPVSADSIDNVLERYRTHLKDLAGKVALVVGGPPCQGFSFSGRRMHSDPRNQLFRRYVEFVNIVRPNFVLVENVPGMRLSHRVSARRANTVSIPFSDMLERDLRAIGYRTDCNVLNANDFGVPQRRSRLFIVGVREELATSRDLTPQRLFREIHGTSKTYRRKKGLQANVSVRSAISDLELGVPPRVRPHFDAESPAGFVELIYRRPRTKYQRLMHLNCGDGAMNSMRLTKHTDKVRRRMQHILKICTKGTKLSRRERSLLERRFLGTSKQRIYVLDPRKVAPTIVTLPDDVIHYSEPRILTVRECARLQSFPDWFVFKGKYTTGGDRRRRECPRYTQVGNAVPPLLAEALGDVFLSALDQRRNDACTRRIA